MTSGNGAGTTQSSSHCTVAARLDPKGLEEAVRADPKVAALLAEVTVRKVIAVPDRLVSFVVG